MSSIPHGNHAHPTKLHQTSPITAQLRSLNTTKRNDLFRNVISPQYRQPMGAHTSSKSQFHTSIPVQKRLIVGCDGTGQSSMRGPAAIPTNVTRLCSALQGSATQIIFYQSGVGTATIGEMYTTVASKYSQFQVHYIEIIPLVYIYNLVTYNIK